MNDHRTLLPGTIDDTLDGLLATHRDQPGGLLPLLHALQGACGYVPPETVPTIAAAFNLSRAEVHGVVTYYHFFRSKPIGRHLVEVCGAESCKAVGGDALLAYVEARLGCKSHHTRADGAVTIAPVYCLGLCAMSPAMMVDDRPYARMTSDKFDRLAAKLEIAT